MSHPYKVNDRVLTLSNMTGTVTDVQGHRITVILDRPQASNPDNPVNPGPRNYIPAELEKIER